MNVEDRAKKIKLLLMDVDGVLTDGRLYFTEQGETMKVFHVRDGLGLEMLHDAGLRSGVITGRNSPIVEPRLKQLGVEYVRQGHKEKVPVVNELAGLAGVELSEVAYIGDDTIDVEVFPLVGLAVAVGDANDSAKDAAHLVTKQTGGRGAVREIIDLILRSQGK